MRTKGMVEFLEVAKLVIAAASSYCGGGCGSKTSSLNLSTSVLILTMNSSGVWAAVKRRIIQHEKVPNHSPHTGASRSLHASQL